MSPVSPQFHTEVTVRIGLKTQLEWEHPFHKIRCITKYKEGTQNKSDCDTRIRLAKNNEMN